MFLYSKNYYNYQIAIRKVAVCNQLNFLFIYLFSIKWKTKKKWKIRRKVLYHSLSE